MFLVDHFLYFSSPALVKMYWNCKGKVHVDHYWITGQEEQERVFPKENHRGFLIMINILTLFYLYCCSMSHCPC